MIKISLTVITFNEEKNILRCLNSVLGLVEEIVIIDSFSTDKTKEICFMFAEKHNKEIQFRFIENTFLGHIQQKNFAITCAKNDYILSLDADEAISEKLKKSILEIKKNDFCDVYELPSLANVSAKMLEKSILANKEKTFCDVYEMSRLTNYCGSWIKHTDWYPDIKTRLFDRKKAHWAGINPHDKITFFDNIVQKKTKKSASKRLEGDILHYSFHTIKQHLQQMNYFTDINAKEAFENGKKASLLKILGSPLLKFFSSYIVRLGFLDGYAGFLVCTISAFASFVKYIKLRELWKNK